MIVKYVISQNEINDEFDYIELILERSSLLESEKKF